MNIHNKIWARSGRSLQLLVAVVLSIVTVTAIQPGRASAAPDPYLQEGVEAIVDGGFPGAWAMDTAGNSGAAGEANLSTGAPTQPGMKMRIGSVTKSFVGAVALQLVAENDLELDDTIEEWLPGLLPYGEDVTVRQLLQHTSGIPEYLESGDTPLLIEFIRKSVPVNPEYDPLFKFKTWTPQQLVGRIANEPRHMLPPDTAEYSDTNYVVLGMIVREVTGTSLQQQIQQRIISPLGLSHTSFPIINPLLTPQFARGYTYNVDLDGNPIVGAMYDISFYNPSFLGATGAMISNPADLNKFMSKLLGGHLLPPALTAEMKQTVPILLPEGLFAPGFGAGLGIWSLDLSQTVEGCNQTVYGHEGEVPGYDTWSFGTANGSKVISMGVNLMVPDWDAWYETQFPVYASFWCNQ